MKKSIFMVTITLVLISCTKKEEKPWQDTNNMLEEPKTEFVDSTALKQPIDQGAESGNVTDSSHVNMPNKTTNPTTETPIHQEGGVQGN